jgi:hypothetical protein
VTTSVFSPGLRRRLILPRGIVFALALAVGTAHAQDPFLSALGSKSPSAGSKKQQGHHAAEKDAVSPSFSIPLAPLGFAPPAAFYLGDRFAQASLDFLDEDTLLFTFRVPGLIIRERAAPGHSQQDQRHIRALTLALPTGKVIAESLWVLHDYSRYLWKLKDRKFLLRDRNTLQIGDAALHLEPFLRFPGTVSSIEFAPDQALLVANTTEPTAAEPPASPSSSAAMPMSGHSDSDFHKVQPASQSLLRVFNMDTRKVMLFSRINGAAHLPLDGEGYYEALRGSDSRWMISFEHFHGSTTPLGWIESSCNPALDALAPNVVLASACTPTGARHLTALMRNRANDHTRLWDLALASTKVWPLLATSDDGSRFARATLEVTHPIGPYNPLDDSDIRGQSVQIYDLADGKVELTAPASPVLDGGGNFALSPSGRRFAVLNDGSIQVFELPPAPPMPQTQNPETTLAKP